MIKADMIPIEVNLRLRNVLSDGETDEAVALAAALNAWPGMGIEVARDESESIILPLPLKDVQNDVRERASRPLK